MVTHNFSFFLIPSVAKIAMTVYEREKILRREGLEILSWVEPGKSLRLRSPTLFKTAMLWMAGQFTMGS